MISSVCFLVSGGTWIKGQGEVNNSLGWQIWTDYAILWSNEERRGSYRINHFVSNSEVVNGM